LNRLVRTLAVTGAAGAMALLAVPAEAATAAGTATTSTCTTYNGSNSMGTGQLTICPQSDGTYHLTGWLDNPANANWWNGNAGCNPIWWLNEGTGGQYSPHIPNAETVHLDFDTVITPKAPITGATFMIDCV
jgi:hypothetical protein